MSTEESTEKLNADFDAMMQEAVNSEKPIVWTPNPPAIKPGAALKRTRQIAFLKAFAECGTISRACRAIGINMATEQRWRNEPWYGVQFKDALQQYRDLIETEVHNRAIVGEQVPIIGKVAGPFGMEDKIIGHKTVKSDLLLMFHGKRHIMEYRDKYEPPKEEKPQETGSPMARITIRLDMMSKRQQVEVPAGAELNTIEITPEQFQITAESGD